MTDLNSHTLQKLESMNRTLMGQRREIIARHREVAAVLASKRAAAALEADIAALKQRHGVELSVVE